MRLAEAHLELLCCPVCHGDLQFAGTVPQSIRCTACGRQYPIVDELPVLLPGRATEHPAP